MTSPQLKSYLNMKIWSFYCKIRNKKKMIILATFICYCTGVLRAIRWDKEINDTHTHTHTHKEINDIHIRAEEAKLSLLVDDIDLNTENPKDFSKNY